MKSIDDAIKHCEEVAEEQEWQAYKSVSRTYVERMSCEECAKEHRQLAEWLKELKAYKNERVSCEYCKYNDRQQHERPCSLCKHNFKDMFEEGAS
jgi:hypothetical protein